MEDLIKRQDAIEATWFEPSYTDPLNVLTEVRDRLKALPSVQPEVLAHGEGELSAESNADQHSQRVESVGNVDLISRESAIRSFGDWMGKEFGYLDLNRSERFINAIESLPSEGPKTGKWITDKYGNILCSECGWCAPRIMTGCLDNRHLVYDQSEFCWHCGARMRGEKE